MIGIVGGTGPYAGIDLLEKVFNNTIANNDQEHLDVILLSMSSKIADRTDYLIGDIKENPALAIVEILLKLEKAGAKVAGIPCNTAHTKEIFDIIHHGLKKAGSTIRLLNMIEETIKYIAQNHSKLRKVGVLSTTGTYKSGVYTNLLKSKGFEVILPPLDLQEELIHPAIYDPVYGIKAVSNPIHKQARENLLKGISFLKDEGVQIVILGCTEITLAITEPTIDDIILVNPTNVLARALIHTFNPDKLKSL